MPTTLNCDLSFQSQLGGAYWCPLIYEQARTYGFQFKSPYLENNYGNYAYCHENGDGDSITGPFQQLWNEIYPGRSAVCPIFRFQAGPDSFRTLEISTWFDRTRAVFKCGIIAPGADFSLLPLEEAKQWLIYILDFMKSVACLTQSVEGEIYWEKANNYAPWAAFGSTPAAPSAQRPSLFEVNAHLLNEVLPNGTSFFFFDQVPMRQKKSWELIALP